MTLEEFNEAAMPYYKEAVKRDVDTMILSKCLHDRCEKFSDIPEQIDFIDELPDYDIELYTHKKMKTNPENSLVSLKAILPILEEIDTWESEVIHDKMIELATNMEVKNGIVLWPMRVALSGKAFTPGGGIEIATLLGKEETIDKIIVFGDTNSTLSGALSAEKLNIPLVHIEAGLRSFNPQMKEEYNRIETDKRSKYLFTPTSVAVKNLENEGIKDGVYNVGDIMYDATIHFSDVSDKKSNIIKTLGVSPKKYYLVTIHRAENTDNILKLRNIFTALSKITDADIILPLHPRTEKIIKEDKGIQDILLGDNKIIIIGPKGYLDIMALEKNAKMIITDSGGIQKEAYFHHVPCITLREETEWVETIETDNNILCGHDIDKILSATRHDFKMNHISEYGDGNSAKKILEIILND
jgi:UDP-GlcNAc3NAcA epimerase